MQVELIVVMRSLVDVQSVYFFCKLIVVIKHSLEVQYAYFSAFSAYEIEDFVGLLCSTSSN